MPFLDLSNFSSHLNTVETWHVEVSEDYLDFEQVHLKESKTFLPIVGGDNIEIKLLLIKCHLHNVRHHSLYHSIIVNYQYFRFLLLVLGASNGTTEIRHVFIE